jgi:hypothetical protein
MIICKQLLAHISRTYQLPDFAPHIPDELLLQAYKINTTLVKISLIYTSF